VREGWKEERTALLNRLRGLLAEYGVEIGRSAERFLVALPELSEDSRLLDAVRALLLEAREQFAALHTRLGRCDSQIAADAKNSSAAQRAVELLGVGPVTASALAATVPDAKVFRNGRQFGA
jgi:transposase